MVVPVTGDGLAVAAVATVGAESATVAVPDPVAVCWASRMTVTDRTSPPDGEAVAYLCVPCTPNPPGGPENAVIAPAELVPSPQLIVAVYWPAVVSGFVSMNVATLPVNAVPAVAEMSEVALSAANHSMLLTFKHHLSR